MFVAEQLLDLAQVRPGAQELGGEHVPQRVRRDALALRHAGGARVADEGLGQDRLRQPPAVDTDKQRRFGRVRPEPR